MSEQKLVSKEQFEHSLLFHHPIPIGWAHKEYSKVFDLLQSAQQEIEGLKRQLQSAVDALNEIEDESSHEDCCQTKINAISRDTLEYLGVRID